MNDLTADERARFDLVSDVMGAANLSSEQWDDLDAEDQERMITAYQQPDGVELSCADYQRLINSHDALVAALGYIPEQIDLALPRFKDADDSDTAAIEVTIGWLREVRDALKLAEGKGDASRTDACEDCGKPTSFERTDPKTQPAEGEVCGQCGRWVCPDCSHSIGELCPPVSEAA